MREKVGLEKLGPPRWKGEPVTNPPKPNPQNPTSNCILHNSLGSRMSKSPQAKSSSTL